MNENNKKLKALAALVKRGVGGEKTNAEKLLRMLCAKHKLDYDAVLNDLSVEEFEFNYKEAGISKELAVQVMARYGLLEGNISYFTQWNTTILFLTTPDKYNEFIAAVYEVKRMYRKQRRELLAKQKKERELFFKAFINRHNLFYPYSISDQPVKTKLSDIDLEEMQNLMNRMNEDLQVHKQLCKE